MKSALLIYPHQLFEARYLPRVDTVFMVEDPLYFGVDQQYPMKFHKQKLILHRASMKRYVEEVLWPAKHNVEYLEYSKLLNTEDIFENLKHFDHVYMFDPVDDILTKRLQTARREREKAPSLEFLTNPNFYLKYEEARQYFADKAKHKFADFYQWQRERFNVLIGPDYHPLGGGWSFDTQQRVRLPEDHALPSFQAFGDNKFVQEAIKMVQKFFPDNPGSSDFIWPTCHAEATAWLEDFVEKRLDYFGPYQDYIDNQAVWVFHSALSSSLNSGLLSPQQVVTAALRRHARKPVDLGSLENFIQRILGWREYMRGMYITQQDHLRTSNVFKQQRHMTDDWYKGGLGIPPFDDMMTKILQNGYVHQSERWRVAGNLMLISEINPDGAYKWFMDLLIDTYDWVSVPNVYGISQYAAGNSLISRPHIFTSQDILSVSHYQPGDWSDVWDGLYWRFIEKHAGVLAKNYQMGAEVQALQAVNPDRRRIINYRAEDFLARVTRTV